jgi:hypothetical protein
MMKAHNVKTTLSLLGLLGLLACGGEPPEASPDAESCEHLKEGPASGVTAAPSQTAEDAPSVATDHRRYDITLVEVPGGKGGVVKFASPEATEYRVFLSRDVPFKVSDDAGPVAIEESVTSSTECAEIKARHTFELGVGTYTFEFGPTAETEVGLVIEEVAHDHAH